jgi:hypothetical protein
MKRWLANAVAAVALLLSLACAAAWVRGYFRWDAFSSATATAPALPQHGFEAVNYGGFLELYAWRRDPWAGAIVQPGRWDYGAMMPGPNGGRRAYLRSVGMRPLLGFGVLLQDEAITVTSPGPTPPPRHSLIVTLPWWALVLGSAAIPAAIYFRRRNAPGPWACPSCGYDRRGTEGAACPECGVAIAPGSVREAKPT